MPQNSALPAPGRSNRGPSPAELLAKMPRKPLTPEQQMAALNLVQAQASQRIKLGQQLFKAAEARLTQHQDVLDKIRNQQNDVREQVQQDVAKSLQSYDQWMGKIDESFTGAIRELSQRLDRVEAEQHAARGEMQSMIARATALMEQTQQLLIEGFGEEAVEPALSVMEAAAYETNVAPADEQPTASPIVDQEQATGPAPIPMLDGLDDAHGADTADNPEDIFGQVLRQLRDAAEDGDEAAAA